jgi:predicted ATPase
MVDISLKYGNSSLSAFGYASFAITLSGVLGDYDGGLRFAEMSKKLLEKYEDEVYKVKVYFVNYCFIRHWKMHANTMIEPLMEAYRSGLMAGNLFSGNWVACYALTWKYFTAQPLGTLQTELNSFTGSFRQLKQYGAFNLADILLHTVNRLSDPDSVNAILGNEQISEEGLLQRCFDAHDKTAVFFLHLNRMQLNYLFGDYKKARSCAKDAEAYLEAVVGLHYII